VNLECTCGSNAILVSCGSSRIAYAFPGWEGEATGSAGFSVFTARAFDVLRVQLDAVCPGVPHQRHRPLSLRRCLSSAVSLPSLPILPVRSFLDLEGDEELFEVPNEGGL
jgi:hypothetical protein